MIFDRTENIAWLAEGNRERDGPLRGAIVHESQFPTMAQVSQLTVSAGLG